MLAWSSISSGVARRILLLFVLASMIPLATLAFLTFYQVRADLVLKLGDELRSNAKSIAMDFHLRIVLASEQIDTIAKTLAAEGLERAEVFGRVSYSRFDQIWILHNGAVQTLQGDPGIKPPLGAEDLSSEFRLIKNGDSHYDIILLRQVVTDVARYTVIARLDYRLLWENTDSVGDLICLLRPDGFRLYCNGDFPEALLADVRQRQRSIESEFFLSDGGYYTAFWSLFESSIAGAPRFIALTAVPASLALQGTREFESIFLRVVGLTLLLVGLVSMRAIRSNMNPLGKLLTGTRALSDGKFDSRVELSTGDEFEELGDSFNQMADRLGVQFELQRRISVLGQQLQQSQDIESTIELIFATTRSVVSCEWMMVTYIVTEGRTMTSHTFLAAGNTMNLHAERAETSSPKLPDTLSFATGEELTADFPTFEGRLGAGQRYCVVPGARDGETLAALVFEFDDTPDDSLKQFLTQVGVLLASSLSNAFLSQRLYYQAHHDHLTGLPNRMFIKNVIEERLKTDDRSPFVVSIFDIDRFKLINDTHGHAAGDELLNQVGQRLQKNLGEMVIPSRFAGDEFIIFSKQDDEEMTTEDVERLIVAPIKRVFEAPFYIGNSRLSVDASLGLARYPSDGEDFVTLLQHADAAMYEAKKHDPGGFRFYSGDLAQKLADRLDIEIALNSALEKEEFVMHYQPVIDLNSGKTKGAEALVRWQREGHGLVMPDRFVEIAEETGVIVKIGEWILRESCRACVRWLDVGLDISVIAVNVASQQFSEPDFVETVRLVLEESQLPPEYLELEVTETSLIDNIEETIAKMDAIRRLGVRISIDDFGTGYSSLQYLKRLPADKLKLDQMFVRGLPDDSSDIAIVRAFVALARQLELTVLAEGCETQAQADFLIAEDVSLVQGWLFSKALPEREFVAYVSSPDEVETGHIVAFEPR